MPSLFRFLVFLGLLVGLGYGAVFSLANFVSYKPREIIVTVPPDKFIKNHSRQRQGDTMSRRPKASDEALVELFLDMLTAERGAGENTLSAYRNDLDDLSAHLRATKRSVATAATDDLRGFIASLSRRGLKASS